MGPRIGLPFAMIGMVRKDRRRTEQLFGEHRPDEKVWPGRRAKGQDQVGVSASFVLVPVRGADEEAGLALAAVPPAFECLRKLG